MCNVAADIKIAQVIVANIRRNKNPQSIPYFINKLNIALKEADKNRLLARITLRYKVIEKNTILYLYSIML